MVQIRDLDIHRRRQSILHGVDLDIGRGDLTAVVGVNGAGKTILLHAIAGIGKPPKGRITVDGLDPATTGATRMAERVGFVFQNPEHQFIRPTVSDELRHSLAVAGTDSQDIDHQVTAMVNKLDLTGLEDVNPFLLSGGQKRRLSVGTALISGPPLLVLDEPTYGQDRPRAESVIEMLVELNREGTTIVVATHDIQLVSEHCSQVVVLNDGRITAQGPTREILAGPALEQAGLRTPLLPRAMQQLRNHAEWRRVGRLSDIASAVHRRPA